MMMIMITSDQKKITTIQFRTRDRESSLRGSHLFRNEFRLLNLFHFSATISFLRQWINCLELNFITPVVLLLYFSLHGIYYTWKLHFLPWWHLLSKYCIFHPNVTFQILTRVAFSILMTLSTLMLHFLPL